MDADVDGDSPFQAVAVAVELVLDDVDGAGDVGRRCCEWEAVQCWVELQVALEPVHDLSSCEAEVMACQQTLFCTLCTCRMERAFVR